jgi:hypothetical protein
VFCDCCLETNVVPEPLASKGCFSGCTVLAMSKYVTVWILKEEVFEYVIGFIRLGRESVTNSFAVFWDVMPCNLIDGYKGLLS